MHRQGCLRNVEEERLLTRAPFRFELLSTYSTGDSAAGSWTPVLQGRQEVSWVRAKKGERESRVVVAIAPGISWSLADPDLRGP